MIIIFIFSKIHTFLVIKNGISLDAFYDLPIFHKQFLLLILFNEFLTISFVAPLKVGQFPK